MFYSKVQLAYLLIIRLEGVNQSLFVDDDADGQTIVLVVAPRHRIVLPSLSCY